MLPSKVELTTAEDQEANFFEEICPAGLVDVKKVWIVDVGYIYKNIDLLIKKRASTEFVFNPFNIDDNFNLAISSVAGEGMSFSADFLKYMEAKHATKSN